MQVILKNGLSFKLDVEKMTAKITGSMKNSSIYFSQNIIYKSRKYAITKISKNAFKDNQSIKLIEFSKDSKLRSIGKRSFYNSTLQSIFIPSHVTKIGKYAFYGCSDLKSVVFSEYSELQSIELLSFYFTSITNILIPPQVKYIGESAFFRCFELKSVEFPENSDLLSIENGAFSKSSIDSISIPSKVNRIGQYAFAGCTNLQSLELSKDSELRSIGKDVICSTLINSIFIPPKVEFLEEGWCNQTYNLTKILVSPENKNFRIIDGDFLVSKSDQCKELYDVLLFARRDIQNAYIPQYIKRIECLAFAQCNKLKSVNFPTDSELQSIQQYAFNGSSIEKIAIPSNVQQIGERAFDNCKFLKSIDLSAASNLCSISKGLFFQSSLESISIPNYITKFEELAFSGCRYLSAIEFLGDNLIIECNCFNRCCHLCILSFPNAQIITISPESGLSKRLSLLVSSNAKINLK